MTKPKIRMAVIGLGWVAQHRHIPAILRHPSYELVGLIDQHKGRAAALAQKLGVPHHAELNAPEGLLALDWLKIDVDAVTIATPPMAHAPLALALLKAGKDVMVEKPFAMDIREGEAMCSAATDNKRILAITHNFQFSRAAQKLARDMASGKLGTIRRIAATQFGNPNRRLPSWYEELPLGLFYDESPHFFYLLRQFAGADLSLQHAHALPSSNGLNTPDQVSLVYRNAQDLPVTISCQFDSAISEWYLMVTGSEDVGILDIFRDIYIRLPNDGAHSLPQILRTSAYALAQHLWQHIPNGLAFLRGRLDYGNDALYARFADAVATRDTKSLQGFSAADALAVLSLQHEAIKSLRN